MSKAPDSTFPGSKGPDTQGPGLWPWGIAGALAVVVIANVIMIRIAIQNPSAPASKDHYGESANWDAELEARAEARALGWTVHVQPCAATPDQAGPSECALGVVVRDREGAPVEGLTIQAQARRYEVESLDQDLQPQATGPGAYAAAWAQPQRGLWAIRLRISAPDGANWRGERELFFRGRTPPVRGGTAPVNGDASGGA